jgi:hypothetical protein
MNMGLGEFYDYLNDYINAYPIIGINDPTNRYTINRQHTLRLCGPYWSS